MSKRKPKIHDCFRQCNEWLADRNAELDVQCGINIKTGKETAPRLCVPVRKVDSRKRKPLPTIIMSHCPFCGASLKESDDA